MHHYNTSLDGYTLTSKGLAHLEVLLCCHDMHTTLHTCCTPCSEGVPDGSRRAQKGSIRIIREMWGSESPHPPP